MAILDFLTKRKQEQAGTSEQQQEQESISSATQAIDSIKEVLSVTSGVSETEQVSKTVQDTRSVTEQAGATTGVSIQDSSLFSAEVLGAFEGLTLDAAGRASEGADSLNLLQGLAFDRASSFNIEDFVNRTLEGASVNLEENRQARVNALGSATGGSALTSTVTKNLQESLLRKDRATLGATAASAEATGQQIAGQSIAEAARIGNLDIENFLALASGLKGGVATAVTETAGTQETAGSQDVTGVTGTTSAAKTATETQQQTEESLKQLIAALTESQTKGVSSGQTTGTGTSTGSILDIVNTIGAFIGNTNKGD